MKRMLVAAVFMLAALPASAQLTLMGASKSEGGAAGYSGPGNVVSGAAVWWGLRAYNAAWATGLNKIANICNSAGSGGACFDVNSDASGNLNLSSAPSLSCNNSTNICTIQTLYDQSGFNDCTGGTVPCNMTQATAANRPTLVIPGAANGCPATTDYCASIASGQNWASATGGGVSISQPLTISAVAQNVSAGQEALLGGGASNIQFGYNVGNAYVYGGVSVPTATASNPAHHAFQSVWSNAIQSYISIDGTPTTINLSTATGIGIGVGDPVIGNNSSGGGNPFAGKFNELGIWPTGWGGGCGSCAAMSTNQHGYWGF